MYLTPWDDRDLVGLCDEADNGIARSQARRRAASSVKTWRWFLLSLLVALAVTLGLVALIVSR